MPASASRGPKVSAGALLFKDFSDGRGFSEKPGFPLELSFETRPTIANAGDAAKLAGKESPKAIINAVDVQDTMY
jgi:hypothetical protein